MEVATLVKHHPSYYKRPSKACATCGEEFNCAPSQLDKRRFCSKACFYKWLKGSERSERVGFACPVCGKRMRMLKSQYNDGRSHYCSQECMMKERPGPGRVDKLRRACKHCGGEFYRYPSQVVGGRGDFCSRGCVASYTIRHLSGAPTSIECALIEGLDARGMKYEFQYPVHGYTIDFAFPDEMLAVEADGVYWHGLDRVKEKDARKDRRLLDSGWDVLRFTGDEIRQSAQGCIDKIASRISA